MWYLRANAGIANADGVEAWMAIRIPRIGRLAARKRLRSRCISYSPVLYLGPGSSEPLGLTQHDADYLVAIRRAVALITPIGDDHHT